MSNILLPSNYIKPTLHKDITTMSFEHFWRIRKVFNEIIGLNNIDHFSINIANPEDVLSIISYNPNCIYKAVSEGWYTYNGTLSPSYYKRFDFFTWDQCYSKKIKLLNEQRYAFQKGVTLVRRIQGYNIMYCFATKGSPHAFLENINETKSKFFRMGDHCYLLLREVYANYCGISDPPEIKYLSLINTTTEIAATIYNQNIKLNLKKQPNLSIIAKN